MKVLIFISLAQFMFVSQVRAEEVYIVINSWNVGVTRDSSTFLKVERNKLEITHDPDATLSQISIKYYTGLAYDIKRELDSSRTDCRAYNFNRYRNYVEHRDPVWAIQNRDWNIGRIDSWEVNYGSFFYRVVDYRIYTLAEQEAFFKLISDSFIERIDPLVSPDKVERKFWNQGAFDFVWGEDTVDPGCLVQ